MKVKAIFASDIDFTLTDKKHRIPAPVVAELEAMHAERIKIIFVTGRTYFFAHQALKDLSFPYTLAVMHGAETIEMPGNHLVETQYLSSTILKNVDEIYNEHDGYFLVYSGSDKGDVCYYFPKKQSPEVLKYFERIRSAYGNPWQPLDDYREVPMKSFPLVRCFGTKEMMLEIRNKLLVVYPNIHCEIVRDAIEVDQADFFLLMITHPEAQKGKAVQRILERKQWEGKVIAAGDDANDISLFSVANFKIAVHRDKGSTDLRDLADYVTKSSYEMGILDGIKEARRSLAI